MMISSFDQLSAMTALLNDAELRALVDKCQDLIADRERIKREESRLELMENLQKALNDIIHYNDFALYITNKNTTEDEEGHYVFFEPGDVYSIRIE